jgi:oligosaccharide 4-alpha-D-glucosyltransferase
MHFSPRLKPLMNRIYLWVWLSLNFLLIQSLSGQVVSVIPENPTADDTVTVIFDAAAGNQVLKGFDGPVYTHTGVIIGTADEPSGWRYVQGEWGTDDPRMRMTPLGKDRYQIRYHIRSFYGIQPDEPFLQLSFVFRNQNGSLVAKDVGEKDIYYPQLEVFEHGPLEKADGQDGKRIEKLTSVARMSDGSIVLRGETQALQLWSYDNLSLQINYFPTGKPSHLVSEAVIIEPGDWPGEIAEPASGPFSLAWGEDFTLEIVPEPFSLSIHQRGEENWVQKMDFFLDDLDPTVGTVSGLQYVLQPGEQLYGTGSRAMNVDRRGKRLYTYNTASYGYTLGEDDLNISIPFVLSSRGYGLFLDSYRRGYFDLGQTSESRLEYGHRDTVVSLFFIPGPEPQKILKEYTRLTGTQPLPPRWALGYIQSRFGYKSQREVMDIVSKTREAGFPLDAILMDLYWFGGKHRMGDFAWDRQKFPEGEKMMADLQKEGIQTILISETYFVEETNYFEELKQKKLLATDAEGEPYVIPDFWAGSAGLLDVFHPQASAWFWPLYRQHLETGAAAWWCDSGEPENHPKGMVHTRGKAEEIHNLYAMYWSKILFENFSRDYPERRLLNLGRSGYAGMQRYATFPWSGDVSRSWDAYRAQPMIMLGAGLCGIGYMHSDLGGFTGGPKDPELYRRWLQFGTFSPIMRVHGDAEGIAPEPIFYDPYTRQVVREAVRLRYQFLPYNYTLAYENSMEGKPLARPLWFHYPNDSLAGDIDDSYLWGRDVLVAPIFEAGQTERDIYLPEGSWVDFWHEQVYTGGQTHSLAVSQEKMPLLIREGAFLPLQSKDVMHSGELDELDLDLHYYVPQSSQKQEGYLYWDDGESAEAIANNSFQKVRFQGWKDRKKLLIQVSDENSYGGLGVRQINLFLHLLSETPKKVKINGKKQKVKNAGPNASSAALWNPESQILRVQFDYDGEPVLIEMKN